MSEQTDQAVRRLRALARSLDVPSDSPPPRIRLMEFDADGVEELDEVGTDELRPYARTTRTTWIDVQGLGDAERLVAIAEILGIHAVALADAVDIPQRAKTQEYAEHVLVIGRAPVVPFEPSEPPPQVCILIAEGYVVSFQERYFGFFDEVRDRLRTDGSDLRTGGPAFLAQALLDALVDRFYPVVEDLSDRLDELETAILERSSPRLVAELHRIQRQITTLRRIARPQVEALHRLARTDSPLVPQPVRVFVQDVHDHAQQVLGRLDAARDVATDTMAAVLATEAQRQNEVMKVLTLVGSIFIPLTFIAGIYGMNFEHMPELRFRAGYPIVLGVMAVVAVGMVVLFRLRGWIGPRSK